MRRWFRVEPNGTITELPAFDGKLESLQKEVGGWVQLVSLDGRTDMWMNEEGKLMNLPVNHAATQMWESVFGVGTDIIVGTALVNVKGAKPTKIGVRMLQLMKMN